MLEFLKPERHNWRHYFGGLALLVLILQFLTGIFLTFFYEPALKEAYKSVQHLTNEVMGGSLLRNLHRWVAFSLFLAVIVHTVRSTLRKDFMKPTKRVLWLTGVLLIPPIFLLIVSGLILPWEWKGYWFMEMIPNYFGTLPVVGPALKRFFIETFTLPRYLVIHILVLPIICLILIDYHLLVKLRKRGIFRYIARHTLLTLPFIIGLFVLAVYVTIPSQDPDITPLPFEGEYIPAPEWWGLTILLPFFYFKGAMVPALSIYLPFILLFGIAFLPYFLKRKEVGEEAEEEAHHVRHRAKGLRLIWHKLWRGGTVTKIARAFVVTAICTLFFSLIYLGSYSSPELGCSSCHNLYRGSRIGVPPDTFKNRTTLPNLDDNEWMMGHWFYPMEVLETPIYLP